MFTTKLLEYGQQYLKDLLTHVNKYTGVRLADEPAVAMLMLINEQSAFFDWQKSDPEHFKKIYTGLFNDFLKRRYADKDQFLKAWKRADGLSALQSGEDFDKGTIQPVPVRSLMETSLKWDAFLSPPRVQDTLRFMQEIQTRYNETMKTQLAGIGCKIPVASTNIITNPAELFTHRDMDYTSQNLYFDHVVAQGTTRWSSTNTPLVKINQLLQPLAMEMGIAAVKLYDKPATSTETDVMWPHEWRSSYLPSLMSTAALQDWDALFQYAFAGGWGFTWDTLFAAKTILKPTNEFNDPAIVGTFPAAALLFLRRDVQPSKNLVRVLYDENDRLKTATLRNALFPFSYLPFVSRVETAFDGNISGASVALAAAKPDGDKALFVPLSFGDSATPQIEKTRQLDTAMKKAGLLSPSFGLHPNKIISDTGEIERDWDQGLLNVNTPKNRGFSGFPGGKPQKFGKISLAVDLPFATVFVSSLDDLDLEHCQRALLTTVGRAENNTDRVSYSRKVTENGLTRGENLIVEPGKEGKVVTEIVPGKLTIPARSVRLTPLAGDMTAAAAPSIFNGKDGAVEVLFGKETPSLWYLLEITRQPETRSVTDSKAGQQTRSRSPSCR